MDDGYKPYFRLLLILALVVNFAGIDQRFFTDDPGLYASISKNLLYHKSFFDLFTYDQNWLDKPHFPFWMVLLSFKVFGVSVWAYRLPSLIFFLISLRYTFLFSKKYHNEQIAWLATIILATSQHVIMLNTDVRAEPYLMALVIGSIYHISRLEEYYSRRDLILAALLTACAIMTKGMFAIIPIGGAVAGDIIIKKQWKELFNLRWLVAIVLTVIFILPEIYCLYRQFDLHPERMVFGHDHVSGVKFFFWDSQFGRFFNTGPIKGHGDPSFFIHTTLWAFLPWSLLLFAAIYQLIKNGRKGVNKYEWYCISGSLLTFLLFSASRFQLPHYLNIVFPFFAIITAQYLAKIKNSIKAIWIAQLVVMALMLVAIAALNFFFDPTIFTNATKLWIAVLFGALLFLPQKISNNAIQQIIFQTLLTSFIVNVYLNRVFYPNLSHYQAGSEAALWMNDHNAQQYPVAQIDDFYPTAMEFYSNSPIINLDPDGNGAIPKSAFLLYAPAETIPTLQAKGWQIQTLKTYKRYWVSRLKPAFLNEATRDKELSIAEVVLVSR